MNSFKFASVSLLLTSLLAFVPPGMARAETAAERDKRMAWFREARFGMFIHWGVYSVPADAVCPRRSSGSLGIQSSRPQHIRPHHENHRSQNLVDLSPKLGLSPGQHCRVCLDHPDIAAEESALSIDKNRAQNCWTT